MQAWLCCDSVREIEPAAAVQTELHVMILDLPLIVMRRKLSLLKDLFYCKTQFFINQQNSKIA
jgi:hypothetical protein